MNVYVVMTPEGPKVYAAPAGAMHAAQQWGVGEVHECPVDGAPTTTGPRLVQHGGNGHAPVRRPGTVALPPGVTLGPDGKYLGPDGSELVRQPHLPVPENRLPRGAAVPVLGCKVCGTRLAPNGYCPRCFPQTQAAQQGDDALLQVVQSWPYNKVPDPTPGAENM